MEEKINKEFGDRLKSIRVSLNLSQEAFASKAGCTKQTQLKYESGHRKPTAEYLINISNAFDVDMNLLIKGKETIIKKDDERTLVDGFRKLNPHQKKLINNVITEFVLGNL